MKLVTFSTSAESRQRKSRTSLVSSKRKRNSTLICPLQSFSVVLSKIKGVLALSKLILEPDGLIPASSLGLGLADHLLLLQGKQKLTTRTRREPHSHLGSRELTASGEKQAGLLGSFQSFFVCSQTFALNIHKRSALCQEITKMRERWLQPWKSTSPKSRRLMSSLCSLFRPPGSHP